MGSVMTNEIPEEAALPDVVTPEMIEAGVLVLWNSGALDHPSAADRDLVRDIYLQMVGQLN